MKADQPPGAPPTTALVRKKLEEAPQGCDINHGHAKLLPWHAVDMNELVDGKSRLAHLAALKMEYELVLRLENASETSALKIPQARLKTEELLIKLSPIYKKFLTAVSSHSDAWKAAGIPRRLESGHCDRQSDFLMFEFQLRVTRQNLRALRALPGESCVLFCRERGRMANISSCSCANAAEPRLL